MLSRPQSQLSRRTEGDVVLRQQNLKDLWDDRENAVCLGGWELDEHPPEGYDDPEHAPFISARLPGV